MQHIMCVILLYGYLAEHGWLVGLEVVGLFRDGTGASESLSIWLDWCESCLEVDCDDWAEICMALRSRT